MTSRDQMSTETVAGSRPPAPGCIVFLNGPPSVGKSTVARAVQELLDKPFFHLSLDDFSQGYPERCWRADDGTLFRSMLRGYLLCLRALVSAGHNVIAESVVTPDRLDTYLTLFAELPVLFVGIRCPLNLARRREQVRADRRGGPVELNAQKFESVHEHGEYDLEIDTSVSTPAVAARLIQALLCAPPSPAAFDRLRGRPAL